MPFSILKVLTSSLVRQFHFDLSGFLIYFDFKETKVYNLNKCLIRGETIE